MHEKKEKKFKPKNSLFTFRSVKLSLSSEMLITAEISSISSIITLIPLKPTMKKKEFLIKGEIVTTLVTKSNYIAYGTKKGSVYLLDMKGNHIIKERQRHPMLVTVLDIGFATNEKSSCYIVSGSVCGDLMVTGTRSKAFTHYLLFSILILLIGIIVAYIHK